jgi:tetratricopeptide (TPR) repeat protein
VVEQLFAASLERIARAARYQGVELLLCVPASNLWHGPVGEPLMGDPRWVDSVRSGIALAEEGRFREAATLLQSAEELDVPSPSALYWAGRCAAEAGALEEARRLLEAARDAEPVPTRITGPLTQVLRRTARRFDLPLVDVAALFEAAAPDGVMGSGLIADNVHPAAEGHQKIAEAIAEEILRRGLLSGRVQVER